MKYRRILAIGVVAICLLCAEIGLGKTPVVWWMLYHNSVPEAEQWLKDWERMFNETHPDIDLKIETRVSNPREAVIVQTVAGVGPDIMYEVDSVMGQWVENGYAMPLDKYIASWPGKNDILPAVLDGVTYGGQLRAMPFMLWTWGVAWNKNVFAEAGMTSFPQTWDEVTQAARRTTRTNADGTIAQWGWRTWRSNIYILALVEAHFRQLGATIIEEGQTRANLNNSVGHQVMAQLRDWWRIGGMPPNLAASSDDLAKGKGAMYYAWSGDDRSTIVNNYPDVGPETIGFARYPGPTPGNDVLQFMTANLMILSSSKNPDAAWQVITAFMEPENLKQYLLRRGMISVLRSHYHDPDLMSFKYTNELMALVYDPLYIHGTKHQRYGRYRATAGNEFIKAFDGSIGITEALIKAEEIIRAEITGN
ncbi:MAG TPA: extracellular solute-binding protein [Firmicutes bacterium]|nr:extracellular solute-binding protein [Bacillota bacterium]